MKVIILLLISLILSSSCTQKKEQERNQVYIDTSETIPSLPFDQPIQGLSSDSLQEFIRQAQTVSSYKKSSLPFRNLKYDKVIAYEYQGFHGESPISIVDRNKKLAPTIKGQKDLNQEQVNNLTTFLGLASTYGEAPAFCFQPGLAVVFFKNAIPIAHISICLDCNRLSSSINIPASEIKRIEISKGHSYPAEGFSKAGRKRIIDLFKELKVGNL